jgi:hypothetical protein
MGQEIHVAVHRIFEFYPDERPGATRIEYGTSERLYSLVRETPEQVAALIAAVA